MLATLNGQEIADNGRPQMRHDRFTDLNTTGSFLLFICAFT